MGKLVKIAKLKKEYGLKGWGMEMARSCGLFLVISYLERRPGGRQEKFFGHAPARPRRSGDSCGIELPDSIDVKAIFHERSTVESDLPGSLRISCQVEDGLCQPFHISDIL